MSKRQPGCGPKDPDSATRGENPEEELSAEERRISLRVKVPAEDGTAVVEMTGPAVPENGLQAFGDWVLAALEQHADGAAEAARLMIAALQQRDWGRADRLEIAISGRGAFRRFKDVLARWPGELDRWYAFSAERQRGRARALLADAGYYVRKGSLPPDPV